MSLRRLLLPLLLAPAVLAGAGLPTGPGQFTLPGSEPLNVFTYKPASYDGGPLLVVIHGVDRDAENYRDKARVLADRFRMLVVVPEFDAGRFPEARFQRGGVLQNKAPQGREAWTFSAIPRLVAQVRMLEGRRGLPYYLIGHSAGGQFLNRLAGFLPGEAQRIVAANPGTLLFPTDSMAYPYGFGGLPRDLGGEEALRAYLAAPLTLFLGLDDVVEDSNLNTTSSAMKEGATRLERARACFERARALAAERRWAFNWRKVEVPGVGHSAGRMFASAEASEALF
jgi:pimeloyl-ACP methyl ester carboxylesterase